MATYKEIQNYVKNKYNVSVKTCWIADMKDQNDIVGKQAPNRINNKIRTNPCPEEHKSKIVDAFKHFNMI